MNPLANLNDAVFIQNDQIKTDSQKVAAAFGKPHKDILQKIKILDCPNDFTERNFSPSEYIDKSGRTLPMFEMTKDGWMFLVMGFTGAKAAQIKIAFIEAFNQMATLLHNQQLQSNLLQVGSLVQLKSGSQQLTLTQLIHDAQGNLQQAEVIWFHRNKLHQHILPISALVAYQPDSPQRIENPVLRQFWSALFAYGIGRVNHSSRADTIALNLPQVYQMVANLPLRSNLTAVLPSSDTPYPQYISHNVQTRSSLEQKNIKCWVFRLPSQHLVNVIEHGGHTL